MHGAFLLVGAFIATRFTAIRGDQFRRSLAAAAGAFVVAMAVSAGFAWVAALLTGRHLAEALMAFAPGGLEAMLMLGAALALDPVYLGLHHIIRFFGIAFAMPFVPRLVGLAEPERVPRRDKSSTNLNE
jgi:uncharacterized protein